MEFPDLGQHCSHEMCNRLGKLPVCGRVGVVGVGVCVMGVGGTCSLQLPSFPRPPTQWCASSAPHSHRARGCLCASLVLWEVPASRGGSDVVTLPTHCCVTA